MMEAGEVWFIPVEVRLLAIEAMIYMLCKVLLMMLVFITGLCLLKKLNMDRATRKKVRATSMLPQTWGLSKGLPEKPVLRMKFVLRNGERKSVYCEKAPKVLSSNKAIKVKTAACADLREITEKNRAILATNMV